LKLQILLERLLSKERWYFSKLRLIFTYGVHGGIKRFYKVELEKEHAATLDHIVAATAG
jgi:hypothetical protein